MATILVAFDTLDEGFERIPSEHTLIRPPHGRDFTQEELAALLPEADVLCSVFDIPVRADLIARGGKLRLIANYAVGYNNIDIEYARSRGITVTNTPHSVIAPTAELAMALLLSCSRRIVELDTMIRRSPGVKVAMGRTDRMGLPLAEKILGIVGYGNIGEAVAMRCRAFGMKVIYYKRHRLSPQEEEAKGITYASLDELLRTSDVVSLHTPYSPETHHLIGERELALMPAHAILITTARGAVVDEEALLRALQRGSIAAAGLDVFEHNDCPLAELSALPNVVMTPHVGTQTKDARLKMNHEMLENVARFLVGRTDISRVV